MIGAMEGEYHAKGQALELEFGNVELAKSYANERKGKSFVIEGLTFYAGVMSIR